MVEELLRNSFHLLDQRKNVLNLTFNLIILVLIKSIKGFHKKMIFITIFTKLSQKITFSKGVGFF